MLNMIPVRQRFPPSPLLNITETLRREFRPAPKPGARIAVGVGSRGISNLKETVAAVLAILREAGAAPFIVPAMGSHGGATPEGQCGMLEEYGITESTMGVPLLAAMDTVVLGKTPEGVPVHFSKEALQSDGIVVINRIKPHTDFGPPLGSGIVKMIAIGLGKQAGAATCHAAATRLGMERVLRTACEVALPQIPLLAGIGLIEDARHAIAKIAVLRPENLIEQEEELQAEARRLMPRLPFDEIDLLIVDRLGKNISGTGMDPNITGRGVHGYSSELAAQTESPIVRRLFVRDITPESHGNALGLGMADFTTTRLVQAVDAKATRMNTMTSLSLNAFKIPMAFDTDREAIECALRTIPLPDGKAPRIVRILDTLSLEQVEVSDSYGEALARRTDLETLGPSRPMRFDACGNLTPIGS